MIEVAHPDRWATSILEGFVTVYLGTLGRMIPIYSTPSAQLETEERYSFTTTLEGRRKAQARPIGRRTWGLNAQFADPREHSLLSQFANGAWGPGPFVFVSADAPVTNILTPAVSMCDPTENYRTDVSNSGPMVTPDGVSARSYSTANGAPPIIFGRDPSPVIPGSVVFASAYVLTGTGRVRIQWYDAQGAPLSIVTGAAPGGNAAIRARVRAVVPPNAHGAIVSVVETTQASMPALTWTEELQPWSDGQGCLKAVVSSFSRDQVLAVPGHTFSNLSFTVMEVG